jgi:PAS domain S-box-containing protein
LALIIEIARKVSLVETLGSIVRTAVEGLSAFFTDFNTSYATADQRGFCALCTARPGGAIETTERRFDVALPQEYLDSLRDLRLAVAPDRAGDHSLGILADALMGTGVHAYVGAPIEHADGTIGLLAIHSNSPHDWTEHEKETLREAADVLALAIDDAIRKLQLKESEEKFRLLAEHSDVSISLVQSTSIVYANPTLQRMTGYSEAELIGMDFQTIVAPELREIVRKWTDDRFEGTQPNPPLELKITTKDGRERWVEFRGSTFELGGTTTLLTSGVETTDRKLAEELILESESRLRNVLDQLGDGVCVVSNDRIVYVNPTLCRMFGYDAHEILEADPIQFLAEEMKADSRALMHDQERGAAPDGRSHDLQVHHKDGTVISVEAITRRIEYGGAPALLTTVRDMTQRKRAEQTAREAESKYRSVVENSLAGVYIVQDMRFVFCNPRMAEMFGYTQDELLELPDLLSLTAEHDRDAVDARIRNRLDGSTTSSRYTFLALRKDGQRRHIEVLGSRTELDGRPAIIGTCLDITERVERDKVVRTSEQRFRALFEQAPIGMVVAQPDTTFVRVNTSFCEMLGYDETELIGQSFVEITHPDDLGGTPESARRVLDDADSVVRFHKRYVRKDGSTVQAETTVSLVRDASGQLLYALAMIEDVTQRHQLETQLQQVQRLESVGQLAGGVAHNFNNALTAIYGYSELLQLRFEPGDPALKDLEQIKRVAEQSANLTRQLLAFSRKEQVRLSVFSLNDLVSATRDMLAPIMGDHIHIALQLDASLAPIRSDRGQMEQVITNLILNARDAMPSGGTLTMETCEASVDGVFVRTHPEARPGTYARLTVADTGLGMDEETLSRVFEPFFTTKEQGKGVGLGLAMVHGAIKQSGGFITVHSTVGVGSSFAVYLPQHHSLETQPPRTNTRSSAAP